MDGETVAIFDGEDNWSNLQNAASSIATALSTAIANADAGADVEATSFSFAQSIAEAYARIISRHYGRVYTTCTNYDYDFIYRIFDTTGYVQAIATAFSSVYTAIRDNNAQAAASCGASGTSNSGQVDSVTGSGGR